MLGFLVKGFGVGYVHVVSVPFNLGFRVEMNLGPSQG